jgi:hypothetical protein
MRDGIYKTLPLGRGWKSLLKSCERESERIETARRKAQKAATAEVWVELSPRFVRELLRITSNGASLLPGFSGFTDGSSCRDLGGNNSPFEQDVLANAKMLERKGSRGKTIVYEALGKSIENLQQRNIRHIEQHYLQNATGIESKPIIDAARTAILQTDNASIVEQVVKGERPKTQPLKRPIDLDEDITKGN